MYLSKKLTFRTNSTVAIEIVYIFLLIFIVLLLVFFLSQLKTNKNKSLLQSTISNKEMNDSTEMMAYKYLFVWSINMSLMKIQIFTYQIDCRQQFDAFLWWILSNQIDMINRVMSVAHHVPLNAPKKIAMSNCVLFHIPLFPWLKSTKECNTSIQRLMMFVVFATDFFYFIWFESLFSFKFQSHCFVYDTNINTELFQKKKNKWTKRTRQRWKKKLD